ncbi:cell division protein FtsW [Hyphobacterium sp. CCMP332]|nr:cell division protein FtsW [Hyphobacterium sp. CCMP332]
MKEGLKIWVDKNVKGDPVIWFVTIILALMSILTVYSATGTLAYRSMGGNTEYYLFRHTFLVVLCFGAMWLAHKLDYRYYKKLSLFALIASIPLLLYTWQFGVNLNEASRWIQIPFINTTIQPSDLAKLALIIHLAGMLSKRQNNIEDIKSYFIPMLLWCGSICGLIALTDFSSAVLLFLTCLLIMFIGRVPIKYLAMLVLIGTLVGSLAFAFGQRGKTVVSRIENYLDPEEVSYQAEQSYIAIATGGIVGKGPGRSDQRNFLPHPYSDFIYAIVIEEYGILGGFLIVILFLTLLYRGMVTAANSSRAFEGLLSTGLSFSLALQALINMAVAVGLIPVTGLPLPLVSMGGTSLLFTGLSIGVILSVSRGDTAVFENKNVKRVNAE